MAIDVVAAKLEQANEIKKQIRAAANTQDVSIPEDAPFADYPGYIAAIPGHLQEKTLTPTAEGVDALPDEEYDGFSRVQIPAEPNFDPQYVAKGKSLWGLVGEAEIPEFNVSEFFAGTLTEFTFNSNTALRNYAFYNWNTLKSVTMNALETLGSYVFQNNTVLTTLNFPSLKKIGTYAMYGCTALTHLNFENVEQIDAHALYNCKAVTGIGTIKAKTLGSYACYYLGNTATEGFAYAPEEAATVGTYAFEYAKVTSVEGPIASVGSYAFAYCSSLTKLHPTINGSVGSYGFAYCYAVNDVDLSECVITTLGTYAFYGLGASRSNASGNVFELDFRNSTFKTVDQYSLGGSSSYKMQYANIYLPTTVTAINAYAFYYADNINVYFYNETPPTLSASTCFSGATNYKLFVPYASLHAYKAAANWSSLTAYIIGYAPEGTFEAGAELPTYDNAGYALTWYTDAAKTNAVTVAPEIGDLYCEGGDRIMWVVTASEVENAQLVITDSNGDVHEGTPAYIPIEYAAVTIDIEVENDYDYRAYLGTTAVVFPYEVELTSDLSFRYFVLDDNFNADFTTATWAEIQKASLAGIAADLYADYLGTTRAITLKNGTTMNVRLVNNTADMYERSDGSGSTGLVFQFEELYATTYKMNSSNTNSGGWNSSYMRSTVMPIILAQLPDDLQAVLATVNIKGCNSGTSGTLNTSADKLFLPAEREIFSSRTYSRTEEWNALKQWGYYAKNTAASYRIKKRSGTATTWWLRSPYSGSTYSFVNVYTSGYVNGNYASYAYGVAPGFCI